MAGNASRRVSSDALNSDRQTLLTLQTLTDYSPRNPAFNLVELQQLAATLAQTQEAEVLARRAFEVAREQTIAAGIALHNRMMGAKAEVVVQYGEDSPAVHAVGRKQKSERSRPTRRTAPAGD
jgi:hypothetical protein